MIARLFLMVCSLISLACFALPMYVIRPFRHQGAGELSVALFVKQIGPILSAACALIVLLIVVIRWSQWTAIRQRFGMVAALLLSLAGAILSHVNVYEQMFHHLDSPQFQAAEQAHIDKDDMVIAVRLNEDNRAYPVREMAYHHVVNDTVGGQPIVSTY
jgi:hypothetical protein